MWRSQKTKFKKIQDKFCVKLGAFFLIFHTENGIGLKMDAVGAAKQKSTFAYMWESKLKKFKMLILHSKVLLVYYQTTDSTSGESFGTNCLLLVFLKPVCWVKTFAQQFELWYSGPSLSWRTAWKQGLKASLDSHCDLFSAEDGCRFLPFRYDYANTFGRKPARVWCMHRLL